ncbi:MAG: ATP synthase F0 subunit C [Candidatus Nomurabacteria bacterium]|jgi:F-type H+-transporting ATPase subunit c|nr:ATP synthase F0 subunit C [Candidatus Nomurabacteria bacterium]
MNLLGFGLTYAIAALGAGIGVGMIGAAALNAAGRNPEKINQYQSLMILAIAFTDALAIIGLVAAIVGNVMVK